MKRVLKLFVLPMLLLFLSSCGSLETIIFKNDLSVKTQMTDTILLEPVEPHQRTIYVEIKNTTGKKLNITKKIEEILTEKGYKVLKSPGKSHYWMRVNILRVDEHDAQKSRDYYYTDYTAVEAGLDMLARNLVKDKYYEMITDIAISERTKYSVNKYTSNSTKQGRSGSRVTTSASQKFQDDYFTRVISVINKANLKFEEAVPQLEQELAEVISGIF